MSETHTPLFKRPADPADVEIARLERELDALAAEHAALKQALTEAVEVARNYYMLFHDEAWGSRLAAWESVLRSLR